MNRSELRESRIRLENFLEAILPSFGRIDRYRWAQHYLNGLLLNGDRKSAGAMAERLGVDEQGLQQFISQSTWDWWAVRRASAVKAVSYFSSPRSALIFDDTGFPKKGKKSPGVARQYSGTLGKVGNCQIGVSISYATDEAAVPLDFELYLPEEWAKDEARRATSKIPTDVTFKKKWELALEMLDRVTSWGIYAPLVSADAGYGVSTEFRKGLRNRNLRYCLGITEDTGVWLTPVPSSPPEPRAEKKPGRPKKRYYDLPVPMSVKAAALGLEASEWTTIEWREGTKKQLSSRFAALRVQPSHGHSRGLVTDDLQWLIIEWPVNEEKPTRYWLCDLPEQSTLQELVYWAKIRWWIEQNYQQLKEELGLDHFEGRSWGGWHRHMTLTMVAFHFLAIERLREKKTSGWTLPRCRAEIQVMVVSRIRCCPTCKRPAPLSQPLRM